MLFFFFLESFFFFFEEKVTKEFFFRRIDGSRSPIAPLKQQESKGTKIGKVDD